MQNLWKKLNINLQYCCLRPCESQISPPEPLSAAQLKALAKKISTDDIMDTVSKIAIVRTPESEGSTRVREVEALQKSIFE